MLLLLMLLSNCSTSNSNGQASLEVNAEDEQPKNVNTDTLKVDGKKVVFFMLSQQEYDSLPKDPNSGIDEALDDFNYYAEAVADTIRKAGYEPIMTGSRYIQIKLDNGTSKTYDRLADKGNIVGYIFSDGIKEPKIDYGVGTDIDLLTAFDDFNK